MVILALCTDVNIIREGVLGMGHSTWKMSRTVYSKTEPNKTIVVFIPHVEFDTKIIL